MTMINSTTVKGNIVRQTDCDGVVNSANPNLRAGSGVCGAIYAAAGPHLKPCNSQFAPLQIGEALATPAFDMASLKGFRMAYLDWAHLAGHMGYFRRRSAPLWREVLEWFGEHESLLAARGAIS